MFAADTTSAFAESAAAASISSRRLFDCWPSAFVVTVLFLSISAIMASSRITYTASCERTAVPV